MVRDQLGKPIAWVRISCIICRENLCDIMTANVVKTPMIICKECYKKIVDRRDDERNSILITE